MRLILLCFAISLFGLQARSQAPEAPVSPEQGSVSGDASAVGGDPAKLVKPLGRVKSTTKKNSESSSFVPDPDSIDPLNPNNENIKDDAEPVLEDIRTVLDAPKPQPTEEELKKKAEDEAAKTAAKEAKAAKKAKAKQQAQQAKAEKKAKRAGGRKSGGGAGGSGAGRNPDDPDLGLESDFNRIYKTYNKNPTPEDVWAEASSKQTERQYKVQKGDTLWSISKILFGDPNFWPKLWSLNKQGILNPHFINPNAIIYFYAGDEESTPTVSVGKSRPNEGQAAPGKGSISSVREEPNSIPPSLPFSRNAQYFATTERKVEIQLGDLKVFPLEYANDLYIADLPVATKVKILVSETSKFRCYSGRLLKSIKYVGKLQPEYEIFERMQDIDTANGALPTYRFYGSAHAYSEKYLKINECRGLFATDLVILPKGDIQKLTTHRNSGTKTPQLVGGPYVVGQNVFNLDEIIYVDFGTLNYEPGQHFRVVSQITDEPNGRLKVIEKFGSYGTALVEDLDELMQAGDRVEPEQ